MGFIKPTLPTVDAETWPSKTRLERIQELAPFWVENGFGTQRVVHVVYLVKCLVYGGGAILVASLTTPGLGGVTEVGHWWTEPIFFQKAVVFSLLFEILGLGCGSGPLTLRILPPIGGVLYWLRPGTVRLPPWPTRYRSPAAPPGQSSMWCSTRASCCHADGSWPRRATGPIVTPLLTSDIGVIAPSRVVPLLVLLPLLGSAGQDNLPGRPGRALSADRGAVPLPGGADARGGAAGHAAAVVGRGHLEAEPAFPVRRVHHDQQCPAAPVRPGCGASSTGVSPTTCARRGWPARSPMAAPRSSTAVPLVLDPLS